MGKYAFVHKNCSDWVGFVADDWGLKILAWSRGSGFAVQRVPGEAEAAAARSARFDTEHDRRLAALPAALEAEAPRPRARLAGCLPPRTGRIVVLLPDQIASSTDNARRLQHHTSWRSRHLASRCWSPLEAWHRG
mmetsp:Transcript_67736/g.220504  ORF Transcript_67736/g.220504 Transcript_67736/m.220504 type:complete len:135 (-) Transcript_67736:183-587(-)